MSRILPPAKPGRPKLPKVEVLFVRVSEAMRTELEAEAEQCGMKLSQYMRKIIDERGK